MTLAELEKSLDVRFPKKFHEIYKTGAMEWLEVDSEKLQENRDFYMNDPNAFFVLSGEAFPISFENIPEYIRELYDAIEFHENLMNVRLDEKFRFIPFAVNSYVDYYCFMYEKGSDEPKIVIVDHNLRYNPEIVGRDFDEFLYIMMLSCVECVVGDAEFFGDDADFSELEGEQWKNHFGWLLPKYKKKITESTPEMLADFYRSHQFAFDEIEVFVEL